MGPGIYQRGGLISCPQMVSGPAGEAGNTCVKCQIVEQGPTLT